LLKNPCNSKINKSGETILINKIYEPYKLWCTFRHGFVDNVYIESSSAPPANPLIKCCQFDESRNELGEQTMTLSAYEIWQVKNLKPII
jgi:hypothetical protein